MRHFRRVVGDLEALQSVTSWEVCFLSGLALIRYRVIDMAGVLQRMAVRQAVPGMAVDDTDPEAAPIARLAQRLAADETQLLYSLCIHGRAELGLAPDEYVGLTMVLLRLLPFKQGNAASAPAEKKTLKPAQAEAPASAVPAPEPELAPTPEPPAAASADERRDEAGTDVGRSAGGHHLRVVHAHHPGHLQVLPADATNFNVPPYSGGNPAPARQTAVGLYDAASFPAYTINPDGYPSTADPARKIVIGFGSNADRYEGWLAKPLPIVDSLLSANIRTELAGKGYPAEAIIHLERVLINKPDFLQARAERQAALQQRMADVVERQPDFDQLGVVVAVGRDLLLEVVDLAFQCIDVALLLGDQSVAGAGLADALCRRRPCGEHKE